MFPEMTEIKGFKDYYVTRDGRIFSNKRNELTEMVLKEDKDGYLEVGLYSNGKRYFRRVHRLVANNYIPNPNNYPQINHKNGIPSDNRVENLEWTTCAENIRHSFRVLNRKPSITTNKRLQVEIIASGEILIFNSIKDFARYIKMSHIHLGKLLNGQNEISKSKKLKPYKVTFL